MNVRGKNGENEMMIVVTATTTTTTTTIIMTESDHDATNHQTIIPTVEDAYLMTTTTAIKVKEKTYRSWTNERFGIANA